MPSCARRLLLMASAAVVAVACVSPTLPLPPPSRPEVTETSAGVYELSGHVPPNSEVYALNRRTLDIAGQATRESGEYAFEVIAEPGDGIDLWYTSGTRESQITEFQIPTSP